MLVLSQYVATRPALELIADNAEGVGYLLKDRVRDLDQFVDAVRRVAAGGSALDPEIVSRLLGRPRGALDELTAREREVLGLMAEGHSNRGIATILVVTEDAIEKHVNGILRKLGVARLRRPPPRPGRARLSPALGVGRLRDRRRGERAGRVGEDVGHRVAGAVRPLLVVGR